MRLAPLITLLATWVPLGATLESVPLHETGWTLWPRSGASEEAWNVSLPTTVQEVVAQAWGLDPLFR